MENPPPQTPFGKEKNPSEADFSSFPHLNELTAPIFSGEQSPSSVGEKYVVFNLDEKFYAVHSHQVLEVSGALRVTPLPNVPAWLAGIANLRGDIISVVSLRKLWREKTAALPETKLIVLRSDKSDVCAAFMVDKLNEIVTLEANEIKFSAADFETSFPASFGKVAHGTHTLYLIDAEKLLASLTFENPPTL